LGESCVIGVGSTVLKNLDDKTTVWPLLNKKTNFKKNRHKYEKQKN